MEEKIILVGRPTGVKSYEGEVEILITLNELKKQLSALGKLPIE